MVANAGGCQQFCAYEPKAVAAGDVELRLAKGFGTKSYNQVRVSVITKSVTPPAEHFFDYSAQFLHKWTGNYIHTAMKSIAPGSAAMYKFNGQSVQAWLPAQGEATSGVLIADPCIKMGYMSGGCSFGDRFQTETRLPELLNAFVPGSKGTDFWGILGDNFYDRYGDVSDTVFRRISLDVKSKIMVTVAGNHDYWVLGSPGAGSSEDQCGNGHMQYYAQDSKAAEDVGIGSGAAPFNFSVSPDAAAGCNKAASDNFFWYNQIGNVGLVGQSGAYHLDDVRPFMTEACAWLPKQQGLQVAILLGHWDIGGLGADGDMAMPAWYDEMKVLPGCQEFEKRGMLKFVMGHTHCNVPHPHGRVGAGFMVAGQGMGGCGNFGVPVVDTAGGRLRFWYFDTSDDASFGAVLNCTAAAGGWRSCTSLASLWLDQPLGGEETEPAIVV